MPTALSRKVPQPEPRFRLQVDRDARGELVVTVLQRQVRRRGKTTELGYEPVARATGLPLSVAAPLLAAAVRTCGTSPERLSRPAREGEPPIELDEVHGARVALALLAVRPLRKLERMEGVVRGVGAMSNEEALYWFARVIKGPRARVLRALRILLTRE